MASTARFLVFLGWLIALAVVGLVLSWSTGPLLDAAGAGTAGPDAAVAAAAALAAWATLGWLCLGLALTVAEVAGVRAGARRPWLTRLATAVTPTTLRSAVHTSLRASLRAGLVAGTLSTGVVTPTLAWAAPAPVAESCLSGYSPAVRLADDREQPRWPSLDRPAHAVPPPVAARTYPRDQPASDYQVRSGDTLWSIAARHLPRGASDAEIARAWPRWWQVNRSVVGPNPSLIRPGQLLTAPRASSPGAAS